MAPTSGSCRSTKQNTPSIEQGDAGAASTTWLTVTDPFEPLFGQSFEVVRISRSSESSALVLVRYRQHWQLQLPLRSTSLSTLCDESPRVTLTRRSVEDLLDVVKETTPCPRQQRKSGQRSTGKTRKKSR
jgi:hypothetical protein